jgi:hypothetical protein
MLLRLLDALLEVTTQTRPRFDVGLTGERVKIYRKLFLHNKTNGHLKQLLQIIILM